MPYSNVNRCAIIKILISIKIPAKSAWVRNGGAYGWLRTMLFRPFTSVILSHEVIVYHNTTNVNYSVFVSINPADSESDTMLIAIYRWNICSIIRWNMTVMHEEE